LATRTERAIFLINGTQGAGKSTVSRLLARRFERSVCIDADDLLRLVVSGAAPLEPPLSLEAERQLRLPLWQSSREIVRKLDALFGPKIKQQCCRDIVRP